MTSLREGSVDRIGGVQGVVGTNDNAEMTDGEELGVVKTVNERHTRVFAGFRKEWFLLRIIRYRHLEPPLLLREATWDS